MSYSPFFTTLYDETEPSERFGRGTHYSILRAVLWTPKVMFHDFAVIWDEDHDKRVIYCIEQMFVQGLLPPAIFIGERKGGLSVVCRSEPPPGYEGAIGSIAEEVPSDSFNGDVTTLVDGPNGMLINAKDDLVDAYLSEIDQRWKLGPKDVTFTTGPFEWDDMPAEGATT